jgi:hypothetical protein
MVRPEVEDRDTGFQTCSDALNVPNKQSRRANKGGHPAFPRLKKSGSPDRLRTWRDSLKWPTPEGHKFSKNLGATSKFWTPEGYHERSSIATIQILGAAVQN